jgi:phosphotriesterase-related protein
VDLTPVGLGRDSARLARFSRATGLQVVMGTGWYRWPFHPDDVRRMSVEDLTARMVDDVVKGSASGGIRSGIIGEIPLDSRSIHVLGSLDNAEIQVRSQAARARLLATPAEVRDSIPLDQIYDPAELKVLRAAARASRLTGAALSLHGVDPWIGYLSVVEDEGADLKRTIVGHAHYIFRDRTLLDSALARGVMLEADYDLQQYPTRAPVGEFDEILDGVAWAIRNGHGDQILLSHDICNKIGLQAYGGGGYVTLENYVFPYLRARGVTSDDLVQVMVRNPARLLTLVRPQRALH